jgi:hypothetical protein
VGNKGGVMVHVENDEVGARIVIGFLESQGIEAQMSEDDAGDQIPSLESTHGVKVLVSAEDAERARQLLDERNAESEDEGE